MPPNCLRWAHNIQGNHSGQRAIHPSVQNLKCTLEGTGRGTQGRSEAAGRALVGLLVHSAADGFAVGASAVSDSASLSFLVAVAMVLHKVWAQISNPNIL